MRALRYWAALFVVDKKMRNLVVHVVDFDGSNSGDATPLVGPTMVEFAEAMMQDTDTPSLGYVVVPPSTYDNDPVAVRRGVYDWTCYAAVVVSADATASLERAARSGNASWDSATAAAVQFIVQSARQESVYSNYIAPQLEVLACRFTTAFGERWARRLMANATAFPRETLARAPSVVNPGVVPVTVDLRPFNPPAATPAVTVGLIYLIIITFFSFSFFLPIHMVSAEPSIRPARLTWPFSRHAQVEAMADSHAYLRDLDADFHGRDRNTSSLKDTQRFTTGSLSSGDSVLPS